MNRLSFVFGFVVMSLNLQAYFAESNNFATINLMCAFGCGASAITYLIDFIKEKK